MNIITFLILLSFTLIAYFYGNKELLFPWFLLCLALTVSMLIVVCNTENWGTNINGKFLLYLLTAIVSWGIGSALIKELHKKRKKSGDSVILRNDPVEDLNVYPINLIMFISIAFCVIYIVRVIGSVSLNGGITAALRKIYDNVVCNNYSPGFVFNQMREIVVAVAYISVYGLLKMRCIQKKDWISAIKLCIPIVMLIMLVVVSTDRNIFLRFAIYTIVISVLFFQKNYAGTNSNIKIVGFAAAMLLLMLGVFFLLGKAKQYSSNLARSVSIYGGAGLYDFNVWIQDYTGPLQYGSSTFMSLIGVVQSIFERLVGSVTNVGANRFDEFITYQSSNGYYFEANIYSALRPYVEDFGYFGVIIFPIISGAFFELVYENAKKCNGGYAWVFYAMQLYPIVFYPVSEQFFRRFHLGLVYEIAWSIIIYCACFKRKKVYSISKNIKSRMMDWRIK